MGNAYAITTIWATIFLISPSSFGEYAKRDKFFEIWEAGGYPNRRQPQVQHVMSAHLLPTTSVDDGAQVALGVSHSVANTAKRAVVVGSATPLVTEAPAESSAELLHLNPNPDLT